MSKDRIAIALHITTPTLEKYYMEQLVFGAALHLAEVTEMLFKAAKKGNVAAQKKLYDIGARNVAQQGLLGEDVPEEEQLPAVPSGSEMAVRPGVQGKKVIQRENAATAGIGTEWGNDLLPEDSPHKPRTTN